MPNGTLRWMDIALRAIERVGFPVVICLYFMWALGPKVDTMRDAIVDLKNVMAKAVDILGADHDDLQRLIDHEKAR